MNNLTPKQQCARIRETDMTLGGFVRILRIIDKGRDDWKMHMPVIDQAEPMLIHRNRGHFPGEPEATYIQDWTQHEDITCIGCIGALLAWFFDSGFISYKPDRTEELVHRFQYGRDALNEYLGLGHVQGYPEINTILGGIIIELWPYPCSPSAKTVEMLGTNPFGPRSWPVQPLHVFEELQKRYPDK